MNKKNNGDVVVSNKLPVNIRTEFLAIPSYFTVSEVRIVLKGHNEEYVVVKDSVKDNQNYYLFSRTRIEDKIKDKNSEEYLKDTLELEEKDRMNVITLMLAKQRLSHGIIIDLPWVVVDKKNIVGFVEATNTTGVSLREPTTLKDLALPTGAAGCRPSQTLRRGFIEEEPINLFLGNEPVNILSKQLCHVAAEMPEEVVIEKTQQVYVKISQEEIELKNVGEIHISSDAKITIRLKPKLNFQTIGEDRMEVDMPKPNEPIELYFDVKPTKIDEGEIWIVFCQGPAALATLKLKTQIVPDQLHVSTGLSNADAVVTPQPNSVARNTMMVHVLENNGKISYAYDLWLDSIDKTFKSDEFKHDNISNLLEPYMEFLSSVEAKNKPDFDLLQESLCSIGARLFRELFPRELQEIFWEKREEIDHLKLYCDDSYIPWEILYICEPEKPLTVNENLFLGQMGMVRWFHGHAASEELKVRPEHAWYITPSISGKELEYAKKEGEMLEKLFGAKPVKPATRKEVLTLLQKEGAFDLFHFAGHGKAEEGQITEAVIKLESAGAEANRMLADLKPEDIGFANTLEDKDGIGAIVVLNACEVGRTGDYITKIGGFAPAFLEKQAGVFIGALWDISDEPAFTFIEKFYEVLLEGKTVAEAVRQARKEAYEKGDATFLAYTVYADPFAHLVKK